MTISRENFHNPSRISRANIFFQNLNNIYPAFKIKIFWHTSPQKLDKVTGSNCFGKMSWSDTIEEKGSILGQLKGHTCGQFFYIWPFLDFIFDYPIILISCKYNMRKGHTHRSAGPPRAAPGLGHKLKPGPFVCLTCKDLYITSIFLAGPLTGLQPWLPPLSTPL